MSINLGSNPFGLYLGSSKIGEAYVGSTKIYSSEPPLVLPAKTIRFKFSNESYVPSTGTATISRAPASAVGTWTRVSTSPNVWDWKYNNTDWSNSNTAIFRLDRRAALLNGDCEILGANLSGVTNINWLFAKTGVYTSSDQAIYYNNAITKIRKITNTSDLTSMYHTFSDCRYLTSISLFDTSNVTTMQDAFYYCTALKSIPLFNTSKVIGMVRMCYNCTNVENGALALYQQASTQTTPPTAYENAFYNCGSNTVTGAAELAQIPSSWGGTGT